MSFTIPETRQVQDRNALPSLNTTAGTTLDVILNSVAAEVQAPFMITIDAVNPKLFNIASGKIANGHNKTPLPINQVLPTFVSGTILLPSTGSGALTVSPSASAPSLSMGANEFCAIGVAIDFNTGNIITTLGTSASTLAAAINSTNLPHTQAPAYYDAGFIVARTVGGNIQNIAASDIYQYAGAGAGGGGLAIAPINHTNIPATLAIGTNYLVDMSGATGNVSTNLPAGASGNDIKVEVEPSHASYSLTINGNGNNILYGNQTYTALTLPANLNTWVEFSWNGTAYVAEDSTVPVSGTWNGAMEITGDLKVDGNEEVVGNLKVDTGIQVGGNNPTTTSQGITIGNPAGAGTQIWHDNTGLTASHIDSLYDNSGAVMKFRMRTAGTPVECMTLDGGGQVTLGGNLFLPTAGGAASPLNYYEEWSGPVLFSGSTNGNTTVTVKITRIGNVVNVIIPAVLVTPSAVGAFAIIAAVSSIPARFCPTVSPIFACTNRARDNGNTLTTPGQLYISPDGSIYVLKDSAGSAFTAQVEGGFVYPCVLSYVLQ